MKDKSYRQAHGVGRKPKPPAIGGIGLGFHTGGGPPAAYSAGHAAPGPAQATPPPSTSPGALPPPPPRPPTASTPAERPLPTTAPADPTPPGPPGFTAPRPQLSHTGVAMAPGAAVTGGVPVKRGFAEASAAAVPAATPTRAQLTGLQGSAAASVHAPRGFVRSTECVGGGSDAPQIVLPSSTGKPAERPASWLQKRLQVLLQAYTPSPPVTTHARYPYCIVWRLWRHAELAYAYSHTRLQL